MKDHFFGWHTPPSMVMEKYIEAITLFLNDEQAFESFRTHKDYTTILSGQDKIIGDCSLRLAQRDSRVYFLFLSHLKKIKKNDLIGKPIIHDYGKPTHIAADTVKYGYNASFIKHKIKDAPINKVVEIGGGYGAMAAILHNFIDFNSYTIIDLPSVVKLCKKYLDHFPHVRDKMVYIGCDQVDEIKKIGPIDLLVADSSMSECDVETIKFYSEHLIDKSNYTYLVHNTNHIQPQCRWFKDFVSKKIESHNWDIDVTNLMGYKFVEIIQKSRFTGRRLSPASLDDPNPNPSRGFANAGVMECWLQQTNGAPYVKNL